MIEFQHFLLSLKYKLVHTLPLVTKMYKHIQKEISLCNIQHCKVQQWKTSLQYGVKFAAIYRKNCINGITITKKEYTLHFTYNRTRNYNNIFTLFFQRNVQLRIHCLLEFLYLRFYLMSCFTWQTRYHFQTVAWVNWIGQCG